MPTIRAAQCLEEEETGLPFVCVWYEGFESLIEARVFADNVFNQIVFTPDEDLSNDIEYQEPESD